MFSNKAPALAVSALLFWAAANVRAVDTIFDFDNVPAVDLSPRPQAPRPAPRPAQTNPSDPSVVGEAPPPRVATRPAPAPAPKVVAAPNIDFKKLRAKAPSAEAIASATKTVRTTLADKFAAAKTPFDHRMLANQLSSLASTEQPPERYVLLVEAFRETLASADTVLAEQAWKNLSDAFEVEASLRLDLLTETVKTGSPALAMSAALQFLRFAQDVKYDKLETVTPLLVSADAAAARTQQKWFEGRVRMITGEIRLRQTESAKVKLALATLEKTPDDAVANTTAGKFYALSCGDWERALPYLGKASDPAIKAAAELDLKSPTTGDDQLAVADAWTKATEKQTGAALRNIATRGLAWYAKAEKSITGLAKIRITAAIARLTPLTRENYTPPGGGIVARFAAHAGAVAESDGYYSRQGIMSLAFSGDERYVASLGSEGICKLWDVGDLRLACELGAYSSNVTLAPDRPRIMLAVDPMNWIIYDYVARKSIAKFPARTYYSAPVFSPDGKYLALASSSSMEVVDATTGTRVAHEDVPSFYVDRLTFSDDGASFATIGNTNTGSRQVVLWETQTLHKSATWSPPSGMNIHSIQFQGKKLLGLITERQVYDYTSRMAAYFLAIRDLGANQPVCSIRTPLKAYGRVANCFSPDGKMIALTEYCESGVIIFDANTGAEITRLPIRTTLAASSTTMPKNPNRSSYGQPTTTNNVECMAFSPSGKYLSVGTSDGNITVLAMPGK